MTHSISPHDRQQTDTYYIVAHFHYVLFGGSMFGIMGGFYYWWPKVFGYLLSEKLGKLHFWTWLIGFNLAFAPMHWMGLQGMPRRIYTYPKSLGLELPNLVSTIGAFVIAGSTAVFLYNIWHSRRVREIASTDPWDARTLEWTTPSPVPVYNFAEVPTVHSLDDFWHRKYTEDEDGRLVPIPPTEAQLAATKRAEEVAASGDNHGVHLPSPSFYPLVASAGLPIMAYGMMYKGYPVAVFGAVVLLAGLYAWSLEPSAEPHDEHGDSVEHDHETEDAVLVAAGDVPAIEAAETVAADGEEEG